MTTAKTELTDAQIRELRRQIQEHPQGFEAIRPGVALLWTGGAGSIPAGWLRCDGSAVSRSVYARLFAITGTTFGAGDGSTTFNLPNLTAPASTMYIVRS